MIGLVQINFVTLNHLLAIVAADNNLHVFDNIEFDNQQINDVTIKLF